MLTSGKLACVECVALLTGELREVKTKGGSGPCQVCGQQHPQGLTGPLTWAQLNHILDARGLWRPKAGNEGTLLEHQLVDRSSVGKYVHILRGAPRKAGDPLATSLEPWFEVRIVGAEPPPHEIYPAYPQSAIGPCELTRESLLAREATLKENIRSMPTAEKLRLAADFVERGMSDVQAANIIKRALLEVEGTIPKVPMPGATT